MATMLLSDLAEATVKAKLQALTAGMVIKVGGEAWKVDRLVDENDLGPGYLTVIVTRPGSSTLYRLEADFAPRGTPGNVIVCEIDPTFHHYYPYHCKTNSLPVAVGPFSIPAA